MVNSFTPARMGRTAADDQRTSDLRPAVIKITRLRRNHSIVCRVPIAPRGRDGSQPGSLVDRAARASDQLVKRAIARPIACAWMPISHRRPATLGLRPTKYRPIAFGEVPHHRLKTIGVPGAGDHSIRFDSAATT